MDRPVRLIQRPIQINRQQPVSCQGKPLLVPAPTKRTPRTRGSSSHSVANPSTTQAQPSSRATTQSFTPRSASAAVWCPETIRSNGVGIVRPTHFPAVIFERLGVYRPVGRGRIRLRNCCAETKGRSIRPVGTVELDDRVTRSGLEARGGCIHQQVGRGRVEAGVDRATPCELTRSVLGPALRRETRGNPDRSMRRPATGIISGSQRNPRFGRGSMPTLRNSESHDPAARTGNCFSD